MDDDLRELLDKANLIYFVGGNPEPILARIEKKAEETADWPAEDGLDFGFLPGERRPPNEKRGD